MTTSPVAPSPAIRPWSSQSDFEVSDRMAAMLWLTKTTVRPSCETSPILPRHLRWNDASPTASTSSTMRMSGSRCAATANASRTYIPLE